jgi:hypothetical protein
MGIFEGDPDTEKNLMRERVQDLLFGTWVLF